MIDPQRGRLYQSLFALAAFYNLAFGAWTVLRPHDFFVLFDLATPRHPAIWSCLGMVVGVYGLGYAYAATRLDRAFPFIVLGLLGKVLGPIGWAGTVASGEWPARTFTLVLFNDLVWWLPFALFLIDGTRIGARARAIAPWVCATLNLAAVIALATILRPGTEMVSDAVVRMEYVASHPWQWRAGWGIWIAASSSLAAFYAWWGAHLPARKGVAITAFHLCLAGMSADLFAESLYIGWWPDLAGAPERIAALAPAALILTGAVGNGLYTAGGILLTLATPSLRGAPRAAAWGIWGAGAALTFFSVAGNAAGIAISSAILFILFCPWVAWLGWALPRHAGGAGTT
jgi:hypothetical protein